MNTWVSQAKNAIAQGQDLSGFLLHCHPDNRAVARKAYLAVRKQQGFVYGK